MTTVNVLVEDPALARLVSPGRAEAAGARAMAAVISVPHGRFPTAGLASERGDFGMLIVDGLLIRGVDLTNRASGEVLGAGDVFRVCGLERDSAASVLPQVGWWGLRPARLAVLDASFTRALSDYPEVVSELASRLWRRSSANIQRLALIQQPNLSVRLQWLLWHLANRFGSIESEGMVLPIPLCHGLLAWLACARRPAVSRSLMQLEREGLVAARDDGTWWLGRQPPEGFVVGVARDQVQLRARTS